MESNRLLLLHMSHLQMLQSWTMPFYSKLHSLFLKLCGKSIDYLLSSLFFFFQFSSCPPKGEKHFLVYKSNCIMFYNNHLIAPNGVLYEVSTTKCRVLQGKFLRRWACNIVLEDSCHIYPWLSAEPFLYKTLQ